MQTLPFAPFFRSRIRLIVHFKSIVTIRDIEFQVCHNTLHKNLIENHLLEVQFQVEF